MKSVESKLGFEFTVIIGHAGYDIDVNLGIDIIVDFGNGEPPIVGRILVEGGLECCADSAAESSEILVLCRSPEPVS